MASGPEPRLVGIEALRFFAALSVLVWHYQNFLIGGTTNYPFVAADQPLAWLFFPFYTIGNHGVELFWCISGFIFTWKYTDIIHDRRISFGRFAWYRFSRLYPLHFVTLLGVAALNGAYFAKHGTYFLVQINDLKHFLLNLAFASYWGFQDDKSFNTPVWSVSVEILVYIFFFWMARARRGGFWSDIAIVLATAILYPLLRRYAHIKLEVLGATMYFYIGAAVARLHTAMQAWPPEARRSALWISAGVTLIGVGLVAAQILKIAGASLFMFPAAILLVQLAIQPRSDRVARGIETLGNMTYASYMIHFPIQVAMMLFAEGWIVTQFQAPWLLLLYLGVSLGLSPLVFHWMERPAQDRLRRMLG